MQRQDLLASIDIFEETMVATRYDGPLARRRHIDTADLAAMLKDLIKQKVQWLNMDPGVIAVGIDNNGRQRHLLVRPAKRTAMYFYVGSRRRRMLVSLPNILAELVGSFSKGAFRWEKIAKVYAFAGPAKKLSISTQLYLPPLPNIYSNARVCIGEVSVADYGKLPAAKMFEEAFIKSGHTDHLANSALAKTDKYRNIIDALKKTKGRVPMSQLAKVEKYGKILKQ